MEGLCGKSETNGLEKFDFVRKTKLQTKGLLSN